MKARKELDHLEEDVAGFRVLNSKGVRSIENRVVSVRISLLSRLAVTIAQRQHAELQRAQTAAAPVVW